MRQITVQLGARSYAVQVEPGLLGRVGRECRSLGLGRRTVLVTQAPVAAYAARVAESLREAGSVPQVIEVPDGEGAKCLAELGALLDAFAGHGLDRSSAVVAVGGGVVGDLAGLAAATYMRGLALVQVPTTLLAQVDASVGGKVAINHPRAKNLIGAFHQPRLVLIDPDTLATLPERQLRSGLAEAVKTGAALDAELFATLERGAGRLLQRDPTLLAEVIAACCAEKARIVEQDEREEGGLRMVLNYGHTVGHALEALGGYRTWLHGEAVAIGMVAAARLSERLGCLDAGAADRQCALIHALGLPTSFESVAPAEVVEALRRDKKARDGQVPFVLLTSIGQAKVSFDVQAPVVLDVLEEIHRGLVPASGR